MQEAALAQVAANRSGALRSSDPEYLHQLRVGLRRLRSALRVFRELAPGKASKRLGRRARNLMRAVGAARDWDVFVGWLESELPPPALLRRARQERDRARAAAREGLAAPQLEPVAPHRSDASPAEFAEAALTKLERKVRRQARRMDWDDARDRHVLRVRVKRLRYAGEFFGRKRAALERLQGVLGELNDVEVARRLLRGLSVREQDLDQALDLRERRLLRALDRMKTSSVGQTSGRRG